jgi:nicotinamidase-related amidase
MLHRWCAAVAAAVLLVVGTASAQTALPAAPNPVAVSLTGASTAVLVLDVTDGICGGQARCAPLVPKIAGLLAAARRAGAFVVYSAAEPRGALIVPVGAPAIVAAVAPASGDPIVIGTGQDRFFGTGLDVLLRKKGITTVVLTGWRINGSLLYTAVGANLRGYTVVVADDATSAGQDYDVAVGRYQLLTQLNSNPQNEAQRKGAVTISRTDLISFR